MSKIGPAVVLIGSVALGTGIIVGDLGRRGAEQRYREAVGARQHVELQYGEVLATHQRLQEELSAERRRSQELTEAFGTLRGRLEEAVGRLADETRNVRELQQRLAAMQEQMNQLRGELALTLQPPAARAEAAAPAEAVELERILVQDAATAATEQGHVISVHDDWHFIIISLGWDAVKIGDTVSIFRDEQLLAKARIERVQEAVSAASLLPEWQTTEVHVNDLVRPL